MKRKDHIRNVYKRISKTYKILHDQQKADEYFRNYSFLNDSINDKEKEVLHVIVEQLAQEKKQEETDKKKLYIMLLLILLIFAGLLYFLRRAYIKKQKKKDELIQSKNDLIEKKDELIGIKSQEANLLKKKVNDAFPQLIKLAKTNDPFFIIRFKEVYPEFCEKLLSEHPDLKDSELKISAFLRLNLTNKEIGQYENISLRAVETRKYRLKKKLGLAPEEDLIKWIQQL